MIFTVHLSTLTLTVVQKKKKVLSKVLLCVYLDSDRRNVKYGCFKTITCTRVEQIKTNSERNLILKPTYNYCLKIYVHNQIF